MKQITRLFLLMSLVLLASCHTPTNLTYFQDVDNNSSISLQTEQMFRLRPEDKINIVVNSKDPALEQLFTLTANNSRTLGASTQPQTTAGKSNSGGSSQTIAYTVSTEGTIDFPVLGTIPAAGKTRQELAQYIKEQLISRKLVLDPIVTIEYVNMSVSVLGEVNSPGRQDIVRDNYTILDAISAAGDLTINGERENVKVMRKLNGEMICYTVNLCSTADILKSPAYYLQQDDVVYVTPSDVRKRQATVNGSTVLTPSFWISVASLLSTITALVITTIK